jgi:hypothetical protein
MSPFQRQRSASFNPSLVMCGEGRLTLGQNKAGPVCLGARTHNLSDPLAAPLGYKRNLRTFGKAVLRYLKHGQATKHRQLAWP